MNVDFILLLNKVKLFYWDDSKIFVTYDIWIVTKTAHHFFSLLSKDPLCITEKGIIFIFLEKHIVYLSFILILFDEQNSTFGININSAKLQCLQNRYVNDVDSIQTIPLSKTDHFKHIVSVISIVLKRFYKHCVSRSVNVIDILSSAIIHDLKLFYLWSCDNKRIDGGTHAPQLVTSVSVCSTFYFSSLVSTAKLSIIIT